MVEHKSIEVGNTFNFGDYYSTAVDLQHIAKDGKKHPVFVASYGIGVSRLVGALAEVHADDKGLVWPSAVAPFAAHVLTLGKATDALLQKAKTFESQALAAGREILFDDRDISPGFKLKDADLIGLPLRIVFSDRQGENVEITNRATGDVQVMAPAQALTLLQTV
jgi:prolyl-tRNA synthetase